jgi:alginate O-acetyltransferase complex protein AlgI
MFGFGQTKNILFLPAWYCSKLDVIIIVIGIICAMPIFKNILDIESQWKTVCINVILLVLFVVSSMSMAASTFNPFIYFRF